VQRIRQLFENGRQKGMFTDFDFSVSGDVNTCFSDGDFISRDGSHLFDIASLTKALNHLLFWKLFNSGSLNPEMRFRDFIPVPEGNGRRLWHFLCYVVKDYNFSYEALRDGTSGSFRDTLLNSGFSHWGKRFQYDNVSSAYLAFVLEKIYGMGIEEIFLNEFIQNPMYQRDRFMFHPVDRGLVSAQATIPTCMDLSLRGIVHDPLSLAHKSENIAVAGLFTDASMLCDIFHRTLETMIGSKFYEDVSNNQLVKMGISDRSYALGFDIPYPKSLEGFSVEKPLVFAGWTGCRIFFSRKPRITICFLTNRVFCKDTSVSRQDFTQFSWSVIRQTLSEAVQC